jgi:hypothetical protein
MTRAIRPVASIEQQLRPSPGYQRPGAQDDPRAGLGAANALGLSTQNPARGEFATPAAAGPGALRDAIVYTRRPHARSGLSADQGALLEVLREPQSDQTL